MNVTLTIPDDFAARFGTEAQLGLRALAALVLDEFRAGRLSLAERDRLLGGMPSDFLEQAGFKGDHVSRFRAFRAGRVLGGLDPTALVHEGRR